MKALLLATLAAIVAVPDAQAQPASEPRGVIFAGLGYARTVDDEGLLGTGPALNVGAGLRVAPRLTLQVVLDRIPYHRDVEYLEFDGRVLFAGIEAAFQSRRPRVRPFVTIGAGVMTDKKRWTRRTQIGPGQYRVDGVTDYAYTLTALRSSGGARHPLERGAVGARRADLPRPARQGRRSCRARHPAADRHGRVALVAAGRRPGLCGRNNARVTRPMSGVYDGKAIVELLPDGRRVTLLQDFGYVDQQGARWDVPAGATVDGASIPQALWSVIGGPFEGKYRAASIVHDWYCDLRSRSWKSVHRMFHEAMLASGVSAARARLMYAGVYWGGPRWSDTAVDNTRLLLDRYLESESRPSAPRRRFHMGRPGGRTLKEPTDTALQRIAAYRYALTNDDLQALTKATARRGLTMDQIDAMVDMRIEPLKRIDL